MCDLVINNDIYVLSMTNIFIHLYKYPHSWFDTKKTPFFLNKQSKGF